ncbi:hypothetical protein VOLCADRAFT_103186 [Volvox carteri f. nagariensis]|uniref:Uncharacterized protein n=1 Tax=Volvox carteri f. nagariensis TaxID=3068 RepID=D8TK18_VOLCA|nr:uncharacterized protein VOLCADRAFT_103186 [Volvox carteri f. nagariensis]EFJ51984.1 hypothetical protein VOLCADRAFT_103186 [Volvox carteri f. nagariensis]|eukprot:XP_002946758.1 hypothetical protein VOLCADRAFT_103186 [Volvox carteri f. nagariensis]
MARFGHKRPPSDLMAMLAAMPALTELHLISACNLLPDISVLLNLPPPPPPASTPPTPVAPDVDADGMSRLPPPAPTPLRPLPAALPLSQRLRRLSLCRGGYQFDTQEGSAQALHLGGHQRLGELPSWVSYRLPHLRELTLESCGLRRVPYKAVSGLRELRLLSMDRCPLGHAGVVSLDAWLPPQMEENGCGMAAVEVLQLRNCNIVALPYTMTRLTNLRRLDLGGNPLGNLAQPEVSYRHRNMGAAVLRYLKESGDRGFSELVCLTRLGHLGLQGCGLGTLPLGVADLTQLTSLDLSGNPELELNSGRVADLLAGQLPQLESLRLVETSAGEQLRDQQDLNLHHGLRTLILE